MLRCLMRKSAMLHKFVSWAAGGRQRTFLALQLER